MSGKFENVATSKLKTQQRWEEGLKEARVTLRIEMLNVLEAETSVCSTICSRG